MTTWVQATRHPWFKPPAMKRRLSANDDDELEDASCSFDASPSTFSTSRRKRVRYNSLERTLAHMTLGSALATTSEDVDMPPKTSPPHRCVQDHLNVILPSSVEEPGTPASEPVDMEVEPDLVTVDSSHAIDDWESIESGRLDIKEVQISSAVLECLRKQTRHPLIPLPCQTSQALVLYRAPPELLELPCEHEEGEPTRTSTLEDDVMKVE